MPDTNERVNPDALVSGPNMLQRLKVCAMTGDRWIKAGKFPPPDLRINGRKYWREGTYTEWLKDQLKAETVRREKGRTIPPTIHTTNKELPEPIDQLGHNGGPPLDENVEKGDPPANMVGTKMRGGENG